MAGAGYKLFQTGDVLTAAQVNTYLNEQTVMVFANAAARTSALTSVLAEGMVSYLQDTNAVEVYNGSAWVGVSGAGDVTEVQAGTGISVASGTGPIPVVTNTMATAIDAEGDLIIGDAADAFQRLAIGSNTHVLTVDTSVDGKIKWAAPAAGAFAGVSLYKSGTQSISSGTVTSVTFDTELFDTDGYHSTVTNTSRITIPSGKGGKYQFIFLAELTQGFTGTRQWRLLQNGSLKYLSNFNVSSSDTVMWNGSIILDAAVNDYFEFAIYHEAGTSKDIAGGSNYNTFFSANFLGA